MTDSLLDILRIDPTQPPDGIPTVGIVIYESMDHDTHTLTYEASDGISSFHLLGLLESAATYLRHELTNGDDP